MDSTTPHFLLITNSVCQDGPGPADHWRFVLQSVDDNQSLAAGDREPQSHGERLELLAVVRGLEALEQPSRVTLVTQSRYVRSGLNYGLDEWRENGWRWERFGRLVPVKNRDLWQRIDRALKFHQIECRMLRLDRVHGLTGPHTRQAMVPRVKGRTAMFSPDKQNEDYLTPPPATEALRDDPKPSAAYRRCLSERTRGRKPQLTGCAMALPLVTWLVSWASL